MKDLCQFHQVKGNPVRLKGSCRIHKHIGKVSECFINFCSSGKDNAGKIRIGHIRVYAPFRGQCGRCLPPVREHIVRSTRDYPWTASLRDPSQNQGGCHSVWSGRRTSRRSGPTFLQYFSQGDELPGGGLTWRSSCLPRTRFTNCTSQHFNTSGAYPSASMEARTRGVRTRDGQIPRCRSRAHARGATCSDDRPRRAAEIGWLARSTTRTRSLSSCSPSMTNPQGAFFFFALPLVRQFVERLTNGHCSCEGIFRENSYRT